MKRLFIFLSITLTLTACSNKPKQLDGLTFDSSCGTQQTMTMPTSEVVNYTAYEGMYYVTNVEDPTYQTLNIYVPEGADETTPIFLCTNVGGYMAAKAQRPKASDASGRALQEGYVVVSPGTRGRNSSVDLEIYPVQKRYTGRAPKAILDLKAAIRYLRRFDKEIPGNTERIITDGTSAGGAMSALMGGTGNHPAYAQLLKDMGAADERDDVFASVCFCPITDLDHADMAYEWLYNGTRSKGQGARTDILAVSAELAEQFPAYLESLHLRTPDGTLLTADNYLDYIKSELIRSAQMAKNAGADIPDNIGFSFNQESMGNMPPLNGGMDIPRGDKPKDMTQGFNAPMKRAKAGEYITDLNMPTYLAYVASTQPLKTAPAFDTYGVCGQKASGENEEFGDTNGSVVNFTHYGEQKMLEVCDCLPMSDSLRAVVDHNVYLMNPMYFIADKQTSVAPHWYIRHGSRDRDTSFPVPVNLALLLQNNGYDVNFLLAWNRPHSGDYALDELFTWIAKIVQ